MRELRKGERKGHYESTHNQKEEEVGSHSFFIGLSKSPRTISYTGLGTAKGLKVVKDEGEA